MNEPTLRRTIMRICTELGWKNSIQFMDDHTLIICPLPTDKQFSGVLFAISPPTNRLMMYVSYRINVPPEHYNDVVEATTRINFGLLGGCLELDIDSREVRYRDGLVLITTKTNFKLVQTLVATTLRDALVYHPVIKAVVAGHSPKQAVDDIESE